MALANYISKVFMKFGIKQKIAIVAVRDSSGTLGTAVSAGLMMIVIQNLISTEQAKMPSLIEDVALPIIELIFYFTLVFWAFRWYLLSMQSLIDLMEMEKWKVQPKL